MATRGYGEGGLRWDNDQQLWIGTVELPYRPGGPKRPRRRVSDRNKRKAAAKLRALQQTLDDGRPITSVRQTVRWWLTLWSTDLLAASYADETVRKYRHTVRNHLIPRLDPNGTLPLSRLGHADVARMLTDMTAEGLSAYTVAGARTILRLALVVAQRQQPPLLAWNVAALTTPPARDRRIDDDLDEVEVGKVLDQVAGDRLETLAVLVLATGLRRGEALRLRWDDVDLDVGALRVRKAKTKAGTGRIIGLPEDVVASLRAHRSRQLTERAAALIWEDAGLIFATSIGTEIDGRNALRWWHRHTKAAGIGRRRFHAMRHTAATLMLNHDVRLEVVSQTLGHAAYAITADFYAKVKPDLQRSAADAMQSVLAGLTRAPALSDSVSSGPGITSRGPAERRDSL